MTLAEMPSQAFVVLASYHRDITAQRRRLREGWGEGREGLVDRGEADPLLLQADGGTELGCHQVAVEGLFRGAEQVEDGGGGGRLAYPLLAVGEEGGAVHQDGASVRDVVAQAVQDREAVGVDVAPVADVQGGEPG